MAAKGAVKALWQVWSILPKAAVTPEEFVNGHGCWGLTSIEFDIAKVVAKALVEVQKEG